MKASNKNDVLVDELAFLPSSTEVTSNKDDIGNVFSGCEGAFLVTTTNTLFSFLDFFVFILIFTRFLFLLSACLYLLFFRILNIGGQRRYVKLRLPVTA